MQILSYALSTRAIGARALATREVQRRRQRLTLDNLPKALETSSRCSQITKDRVSSEAGDPSRGRIVQSAHS